MTNKTIEEKLYCSVCKRKTNHAYIEKVDISENIMGFNIHHLYCVTRCLGCDNHAFLEEYSDDEMVAFDHEGDFFHYTNRKVYPEEPTNYVAAKEDLFEPRDFSKVPELIEMLYSQVVASYNTKHYLLCAVGLRMIVEAICKELDIERGKLYELDNGAEKINPDGSSIFRNNLEGKINALYERNILVWQQTLILHQIRDLGNATAHELVVPTNSTIKSGIGVIENILHNIFDLNNYQLSE